MVKQEVEMMEAITGWETANEYRVFKDRSEIYRVREQSNGCSRQCLKSARPFTLYIADSSGNPFLRCESHGDGTFMKWMSTMMQVENFWEK